MELAGEVGRKQGGTAEQAQGKKCWPASILTTFLDQRLIPWQLGLDKKKVLSLQPLQCYKLIHAWVCSLNPSQLQTGKKHPLPKYAESETYLSELRGQFYIEKKSSIQSLSRVQLFVTTWTAARQASLSITNSRSSLRLTSIKSVMPSSHLILCRPLLLLPPIPPSIRVFSNE